MKRLWVRVPHHENNEESSSRKLKHVVAELTLDNRALKDVLSENF